MEHGFSALKEMGLDAFAEVFVGALIYDNRGFGASDAGPGQPRLEIIPSDQISDFQDVITYAQSLPEVDPKKIGIWGSSYAGGNAVVVAATDKRVKTIISQVPFIDGPTTFSRIIAPSAVAGLNAQFEADRLSRAAGKPAAMLPVITNDPLVQSALSTSDAAPFFAQLPAEIPWKNEVTLRSMEAMRVYAPTNFIEFIAPAPLLKIVQDGDFLTAADLSLKAFAKALEPKELLILKGGHFEAYSDENLKIGIGKQVEFLQRTLCSL